MASNEEQDFSEEDMLAGLITQISAYVEQYHGGEVEMVSLEGNKLEVRLGGACVGCPFLPPPCKAGWQAQ